MRKLLTAEEARNRLSRLGKTHDAVAREIGVPTSIISGLLYGRLKGVRGDAHRAAVALGLKDGVIVADGTSIADAMRAAG